MPPSMLYFNNKSLSLIYRFINIVLSLINTMFIIMPIFNIICKEINSLENILNKTEQLINAICKFYDFKNYTICADALDISPQMISQWIKRDSLGTALNTIIKLINNKQEKFSLDNFFFPLQKNMLISEKTEVDPVIERIFIKNQKNIIRLLAKDFIKELMKNSILQKEYKFEHEIILITKNEKDEILRWAIKGVCQNVKKIPDFLSDEAFKKDEMRWRERALNFCILSAEQKRKDDFMMYMLNTLESKLESLENREIDFIISNVNFENLF